MSEIQDLKELRIWEKGMSIAEKCYSLTNLILCVVIHYPLTTDSCYKRSLYQQILLYII